MDDIDSLKEPTGQDPDGTIDNAGLEKMEPSEKPETPVPKKRKKYSPRGGTTCPKCGGNLRTIFWTLNEGGNRSSKTTEICPVCDAAFEIHAIPVPVLEKKVPVPVIEKKEG
jgi:hypothetical protein